MGIDQVAQPVKQVTNVFWQWGIPLIAGSVGYFLGDIAGIGNKLSQMDKNQYIAKGLSFVKSPYDLFGAMILFSVGLTIWRMMGATIGKILGLAIIGMGANSLFKSL